MNKPKCYYEKTLKIVKVYEEGSHYYILVTSAELTGKQDIMPWIWMLLFFF